MSVLGRGRGSWKKPEQLVRQHSGGLLVEHLPGEYQHVYGKPIPPEWPSVVENCPDLTEEIAPGVGTKILYDSNSANFINQEAENTWIVEVLEVQSTADISVKTDDDVEEKCSLCALEDLHDDEELTIFVKEVLCQRLFTCHLVSVENPPSVVLYDTSNNMNLRFAEQTALRAAPIQLKEGMSPSVRVTYIADKMLYAYVRLTEQYFELLKNSLNMVMRLKSETKRKRFVVCKKDMKKLCILQINSNWYRVAVKSQTSLTEVTVKLVDVGSTISVDPFSLIVLDSVSTVFSNVPHQAVEVVLDPVHNVPHIHDLLVASKNKKNDLIMKVLKVNKVQPPLVVFRDPEEKIVFSSKSPDLAGGDVSHQPVDHSINALNASFSSLSINSQPLDEKPAPLSSEGASAYDSEADVKFWKSLAGKRFKVYVSSATSPLDIVLQLSKNRPALEMLMEMIQEHYDSRAAILDDPGELQLKTAYAAFVKDWWYRVRIVTLTDDDIGVHLMDYGNQVNVRRKQIRKLPKELDQEMLPFQALRAELKGARELTSNDQDTAKGLEDLLSDKTFTCKVWSVESDHMCSARIVVDLYNEAGNSVFEVLYPDTATTSAS